jgi:hypothetical protein
MYKPARRYSPEEHNMKTFIFFRLLMTVGLKSGTFWTLVQYQDD